MEGLVDGSPLSSAPTSVSSSPMIISNCSSAPINSSSQILGVQDSTDLINVEYSKAAVPDANEKQMNNEKLQKQVAIITLYSLLFFCWIFSELFDLISGTNCHFWFGFS